MRRLTTLAALLVGFIWPIAPAMADGCQFVLGFASMAQAIPQVGQCLENQHSAANGDSQQQTTGGLLVWRKADNWTAFTDGYHTWVSGPQGLQQRLNTERFCWEAPPGGDSSQGPCIGASGATQTDTGAPPAPVLDAMVNSGFNRVEISLLAKVITSSQIIIQRASGGTYLLNLVGTCRNAPWYPGQIVYFLSNVKVVGAISFPSALARPNGETCQIVGAQGLDNA